MRENAHTQVQAHAHSPALHPHPLHNTHAHTRENAHTHRYKLTHTHLLSIPIPCTFTPTSSTLLHPSTSSSQATCVWGCTCVYMCVYVCVCMFVCTCVLRTPAESSIVGVARFCSIYFTCTGLGLCSHLRATKSALSTDKTYSACTGRTQFAQDVLSADKT